MNIQSLSISVPTNTCVNDCKFCVSKMHNNDYKSMYFVESDYRKRLKFARDNGCNTLIITGTGEPLQNKNFLSNIAKINNELPSPFLWIELQTSGVMLSAENLLFLKEEIGVTNISLSLSNVFNSSRNSEICGIPKKLEFKIIDICTKIKNHNFNLRLSLNMTSDYNIFKPDVILNKCKKLNANQITFRKLYITDETSTQGKWVAEHQMDSENFKILNSMIAFEGTALEILPFGAVKYSIKEMSVVIDEDCMAEELKDTFKYLILREDGRLYSRWDDKGSLVF